MGLLSSAGKKLLPKNTKLKIELLEKGRTVFKEIQYINDNKTKSKEEKEKEIIKKLEENKTLFEKKSYLDNDSLLNYIARFNTKCLHFSSLASKMELKINDSIKYLAEHPKVTLLMGEILGDKKIKI